MGPEALAQVLRPLAGMFSPEDYPDLLQGISTPDDAAVWRLDGERALVLTSDFFPPVVDDPFSFGAIAAANALSDLYAMGATPTLAINLVGFPSALDGSILSEILRGGAEKVREAGAVIAGGHTTDDKEPKYGLAVIGMVHPDRIWTKGGVRPGDRLFLTKPIGTGVVTTALKHDEVDANDLFLATSSMMRLHRLSMKAIERSGVKIQAATDITGFSLAGHASEMAEQSGLTLRLNWRDIPLLPGAERYANEGLVPGGSRRNQNFFGPLVKQLSPLDEWQEALLFDPQTSGGLLLAVDADDADRLRQAFIAADENLFEIGEARAADPDAPVRIEID
jgi:selenide,water dikinase